MQEFSADAAMAMLIMAVSNLVSRFMVQPSG